MQPSSGLEPPTVRQTGKSTLMQSAELADQSRQYLTFDDPGILAAATRDPNGFLAGLRTPVTLDEVQRVPELSPVIKAAIEQPGRFLLAGSANVMLLPKLSESLAGGMDVLTLGRFRRARYTEFERTSWILCFCGSPLHGRERLPRSGGRSYGKSVLAGGDPQALARQSATRRVRSGSALHAHDRPRRQVQ
jgi:uncharacterized protein